MQKLVVVMCAVVLLTGGCSDSGQITAESSSVSRSAESVTTSKVQKSTTATVLPPSTLVGSLASATLQGPAETAPPGNTTEPNRENVGQRVMTVDFDELQTGSYSEADIKSTWPNVKWANVANKAEVLGSGSEKFLRVHYPQGSVGPGEGGAQWFVELDNSYEELYLSYRVRFNESFDFVKGGKLPGLVGGEANTGGDKPNGRDGWSARMMWRSEGGVVQYVYHPDQPTTYGEDFVWQQNQALKFPPGVWVTVTHRVVMNEPGKNNGLVQGWFNGELALNANNIRFRNVDTFSIDGFHFSTFFGGSGKDWQASKNEYVDFDDFIISQTPIVP